LTEKFAGEVVDDIFIRLSQKTRYNDNVISRLAERSSIDDPHSLKLDNTQRKHPASLEKHYPEGPFSLSQSANHFSFWFSP
jgi:hypothetical protein